ncbi:hypothetical protein ABT255_54630, partial [Streptomyces mirabilis]|uniref:hypothetical protein n=1 Tax=Streptomyces mirabilis TaxID=68239 RepID=UPI0033303242
MDVAEEGSYGTYESGFRFGLQRLAEALLEAAGAHDVIADLGGRLAVAERSNGPLYREQDLRAPVGQEVLPPDAVEERGGEVAAAGAAVEEEELAHHGGHALVVVLAVLVAPAGQHGTDLSDLRFDQAAAEDAAGERQPVEADEGQITPLHPGYRRMTMRAMSSAAPPATSRL